ncbi:hypothetical protein MUK42_05053 [Musa troglodytarum]|uniref:Uncharacterized protein n=1 Tax=Musa troglodytarum TaxID=320322 RepID=A0A9E7GL54_9LILI|nr:hypothetical protein MUK42_05053 [Musa troglodytarum]
MVASGSALLHEVSGRVSANEEEFWVQHEGTYSLDLLGSAFCSCTILCTKRETSNAKIMSPKSYTVEA